MICLGIRQSLANGQSSFVFVWVGSEEMGAGGFLGERGKGNGGLDGFGGIVGVGRMDFSGSRYMTVFY